MSTKVAVKPTTELVPQEEIPLPAAAMDLSSFEDFAGEGLENVTAKDLMIPRLAILQGLSPQVNKSKGEYIEGASPGDICDVGTGEICPTPLLFLPVHFAKVYLEWYPRKSNKGLANIHHDASILEKCTTTEEDKRPVLANGNYIQETSQFYGLNLSLGGRQTFIPMASTQLKKAKKWLTLATGEKRRGKDGREFTPPLFFRTYSLTVVPESNAEGDWFGWKIERGPMLSEIEGAFDLFDEAVRMRKQILSGEVKADLSTMEEGTVNIDQDPNEVAM